MHGSSAASHRIASCDDECERRRTDGPDLLAFKKNEDPLNKVGLFSYDRQTTVELRRSMRHDGAAPDDWSIRPQAGRMLCRRYSHYSYSKYCSS